MQIALFILYFLLFSAIFHAFKLNKNTGLPSILLIIIFGVKVVASSVNLYFHNNILSHSDVSFFHWQSIGELQTFKTNPKAFLNEWLFNWGEAEGRLNFFKRENNPFWSNLGSLFHGKFMVLSNILSFGHIYVNVIFYNVFFFWGQLLLYKTFYQLQPQKKWLYLVSIFFIPSVLFWCSGIHKDGWILTAIGFICYFGLKYKNTFSIQALLIVLINLCLLFIIRYFYFLCFLPPLFLWIFSKYTHQKMRFFLLSYVLFFTLFFTLQYIFPSLDPMQIVANKQSDFLTLSGFTDIYLPKLENSFWSYIQCLPYALYHILLLPNFSIHDPIRYQIAALDSYLIFITILVAFRFIKKTHLNTSYYLFLLFFSISIYLFIGFTIPNEGALVRYKSEFTALLIPTLIALSEIPFLKRFYVADHQIN